MRLVGLGHRVEQLRRVRRRGLGTEHAVHVERGVLAGEGDLEGVERRHRSSLRQARPAAGPPRPTWRPAVAPAVRSGLPPHGPPAIAGGAALVLSARPALPRHCWSAEACGRTVRSTRAPPGARRGPGRARPAVGATSRAGGGVSRRAAGWRRRRRPRPRPGRHRGRRGPPRVSGPRPDRRSRQVAAGEDGDAGEGTPQRRTTGGAGTGRRDTAPTLSSASGRTVRAPDSASVRTAIVEIRRIEEVAQRPSRGLPTAQGGRAS